MSDSASITAPAVASPPAIRRVVDRLIDSMIAWPVASIDDGELMLRLICRSRAELDAAVQVLRQRARGKLSPMASP